MSELDLISVKNQQTECVTQAIKARDFKNQTTNYMLYREFARHFRIYFIIVAIFQTMAVVSQYIVVEAYNVQDQNIEIIRSAGQIPFSMVYIFAGSFLVAFFSSFLDVTVVKRLIRKRSLRTALIGGIITQAVALITVMILMIESFQHMLFLVTNSPSPEPTAFDIFFVSTYLVVAVGFSKFVIEIDRKLGPGKLWKVLSGRFYTPQEDLRIFMFIDMKGATTVAESLGHMNFSKLLQDCFHDFSIVDQYGADIYQYVGDEVVVSWRPKNGLRDENFLHAFFAFHDLISSKEDYYIEKYGIRPYFKAGANLGRVIITEVGDVKREITYHGDTVNTASRIQDMCNLLDAQMLIPHNLYGFVKNSTDFDFEDLGDVAIKGKENQVHLYKVTRK